MKIQQWFLRMEYFNRYWTVDTDIYIHYVAEMDSLIKITLIIVCYRRNVSENMNWMVDVWCRGGLSLRALGQCPGAHHFRGAHSYSLSLFKKCPKCQENWICPGARGGLSPPLVWCNLHLGSWIIWWCLTGCVFISLNVPKQNNNNEIYTNTFNGSWVSEPILKEACHLCIYPLAHEPVRSFCFCKIDSL